MLERILQAGINGALTSVLFVIFIILPIILIQTILKKTFDKIKTIKSSTVNSTIENKKKEDILNKTYKISKTTLISVLIIALCILGYILYSYNQNTLNSLNEQIEKLTIQNDLLNRKINAYKEKTSSYDQFVIEKEIK